MANTKVKAEQLEAAQTNITSLGTLTSLTVDDITINGSTISDGAEFTIDVGGDINLDADGGDINLKDGGTLFGQISNSSGLYLVSSISDADIFIRGNDGGSMVNALTFDMSAGGNATFTGEVTFNKDIGLGMNGASFGTGTPTINFKGTSNANTRAGAINFKENNDDDVAALYVTDGSDGYGTVLAAYQGDIKFSTATLAGYKMTIKADGKVGIGTTAPGQKLTVAGAVESTSAQGNAAFYATTAGSYNQQNGSGGTAWAYGATGGSASPASAASTTFGMHHWNGSAWSNYININTNGSLMVGTTAEGGSLSNSNPVTAGRFRTFTDVVGATHNTPTTMFSLPSGLGTYIITAGFNGIGNTAAYSTCAIVHGDGTSYKLTTLTTSTSMSWDIAGSNVRIQQSSGSTLNVSVSMIRIQ